MGIRIAIVLALTLLAGCGPKQPTPPPNTPPPATPPATTATSPDAAAPATAETAGPESAPLASTPQTWTPEQLEALLAPIALYPDPVLVQVLSSVTNPQEVLDAGNWLIANPELKGKALDEGAEKVGFTPPVRAIMQFRNIVDQLCMEMGWTTELGQAYTNDQVGVLAAVQRLRTQAADVGNLKSSDQMKVETKKESDGSEAIVIQSPDPKVVYVPTYDPQAVYAPPPPAQPAPATTSTTVATSTGYSTGAMVTTGLLSFGAGLLVSEVFDDDDDDYYRYPSYWGGYPPPPPYPYRPVYGGGGYRPGYNYNRPVNYDKVLSDNNVVVVNRDNDTYWKNFDNKPGGRIGGETLKSPITTAKANRDVSNLGNAKAPSSWKGQTGYAGAKPEVRAKANLPVSPRTAEKAAANASAAKGKYAGAAGRTSSEDRGYAGGGNRVDSRAGGGAGQRDSRVADNRDRARPTQPRTTAADKRPQIDAPSRPRPMAGSGDGGRRTAASGVDRGGSAARTASQRGRSSMSGSGHRGGGGGGRRR